MLRERFDQFLHARQDHDPVDWFLFESGGRERAVNFSSAFTVLLARSIGLPARVVPPVGSLRRTRRDSNRSSLGSQAHQWAEVAFEGISVGSPLSQLLRAALGLALTCRDDIPISLPRG